MHAVEVLALFLQVKAHVHVVAGRELGQVRINKIGVVDELGLQLQKLIHLLFRQLPVDAVAAKAPAVPVVQILHNQPHQARHVRPLQPR